MDVILEKFNIKNHVEFNEILIFIKLNKFNYMTNNYELKQQIKLLISEIEFIIKIFNYNKITFDTKKLIGLNKQKEIELLKSDITLINNISFIDIIKELNNLKYRNLTTEDLLIKLKVIVLKYYKKHNIFSLTIVYLLSLVDRPDSFNLINIWLVDLMKELKLDSSIRVSYLGMIAYRYNIKGLLQSVKQLCDEIIKDAKNVNIKKEEDIKNIIKDDGINNENIQDINKKSKKRKSKK